MVGARMRSVLAVVGAIIVPAVTFGMGVMSLPLLAVPWIAEFAVPRSTVMSVLVLTSLGLTFAAPVVGWLIFKTSPRAVVIGGAMALAAGLLLAAQARAFWQVAAAYALLVGVGAAFSGSLPARTVAIRHYPQRAGALSGLIMLGISLGGALIPIAAAAALASYGWRPALMGAAAILIVLTPPAAWLLLVSPTGGADRTAETSPGGAASKFTAMSALRRVDFWLILGGVLPMMAALSAVQANIVVIADEAGVDLRRAGYLVSIAGAGGAVGAVAIGWLADRTDLRLVYTGAALMAAAALASLLGQSNFIAFAAAVALLGVAAGGAIPMLSVLVIRHFGLEVFPRVLGLMLPFLMPAIFGAMLAGWIHDVTGGYGLVYIATAALMAPGALAMWRLSPRPRVEPAAADMAEAAPAA